MPAVSIFHLGLLLLAIAVLLSMLADKLRVPPAVPLVAGGVALAIAPGIPELNLDPALILVVFLPPLLFHAAYFTVWRDFKTEIRPIGMLSLGAVVFTTASVGWVAHSAVASLPWAACFALGAIVSPPDAVSARAIFERVQLPRRLQTILEGESLVNDASGLVLYRFAVAAALSGGFEWSSAATTFVWLAAAGVGVGLLVAGAVTLLLKRLRESRYIIVITLLCAYGSYISAEALHASGVLAVVSAGLLIGWRQHEVLGAEARSDSHATWDLAIFILEALVFVLIGLSLRGILDRMGGRSHVWQMAMPLATAVTLTVILSRFVWVFLSSLLSRIVTSSSLDRSEHREFSSALIIGWAGMRGVVSLAAALALPRSFPGRDSVLFATFVVILVTVLLQGLTLGPFVRWLGLKASSADPDTLSFSEARVKVNAAGVRALETIVKPGESDPAHPQLLDDYRSRMRATERLRDEDATIRAESHAHFKAALSAVEESRAELLRLLEKGDIHESIAHQIEEELDLDEIRLRRLTEMLPADEARARSTSDR